MQVTNAQYRISDWATMGVKLHRTGARRVSSWQEYMPETLVGDYLMVPLNSVRMVHGEADLLNNGCHEVIDRCAAGSYCLISVRSRSGEPLATLGFCRDGRNWHLDRCFGPANNEMLEEVVAYLDDEDELQTEHYPTEIYYVALEVVRLLHEGCRIH